MQAENPTCTFLVADLCLYHNPSLKMSLHSFFNERICVLSFDDDDDDDGDILQTLFLSFHS